MRSLICRVKQDVLNNAWRKLMHKHEWVIHKLIDNSVSNRLVYEDLVDIYQIRRNIKVGIRFDLGEL